MCSRRQLDHAVVLAVALIGVVACGMFGEGRSRIATRADGLRTFTLSPRGDDLTCDLSAAIDPVMGVTRGEPLGAPEPVRVEVPGGHRVSVVWPEGFTFSREPDATLYDERGRVVAREGGWVTLDQTRRDEAAGTWDDPYVAHGLALGSCYPYRP